MTSNINRSETEEPKYQIVHVVQREDKGIPEEPFVTYCKREAFEEFQKLPVEQGFNKKKEYETITQYGTRYWDAFDHRPIDCPNFDPDMDIQWWDIGIAPKLQNSSVPK